MNFSEEATGGVLWKRLFLLISQYSQESCRPATLLKRESNTCFFSLNIAKSFRTSFPKNICQVSNCFSIDSFIKFTYLLTGYKQLSYYEFDRNLSIRVSLAKD